MGRMKERYIEQMNELSRQEFEQEEALHLEQVAYSKGLIPPLDKERQQHAQQVEGFNDLLRKRYDKHNSDQ